MPLLYMKPILFIFVCLFCTATLAQQVRGRSDDDLRLRRERLREFRQEIHRQPEDLRAPMRLRNDDDASARGLRRLSPEERQRMRQDMRDAWRR